jgi:hypothetical protein
MFLLDPKAAAQLAREGWILSDLSVFGDLIDEAEATVLRPSARNGTARGSLSAAHGLGAFPGQTDGAHLVRPPRWVLFWSMSGDSDVATVVWDVRGLGAGSELATDLVEGTWSVRGGRIPFYSSVLAPDADPRVVTRLRYNALCMTPLTPRARAAQDRLDAWLGELNPACVRWEPRSALLLDNWRVLHGREAVTPAESTSRVLARRWFWPDRR